MWLKRVFGLSLGLCVSACATTAEPQGKAVPAALPKPAAISRPVSAPASAPASATGLVLRDCTVRLVQDAIVLTSTTSGDPELPTYRLRAAPFRIEVTPTACAPGLAFTRREALGYLRGTPMLFSGSGYWQAGDLASAGVLTSGATGNPRTTLDEEVALQTSDKAWAAQVYRQACDKLGYCPAVAKTHRTAWPFLDPKTLDNRGFAEFTLFDKFKPMSAAEGRELLAVVYTVELEFQKDRFSSPFHVLKPHVLALKF